MEKEENSGRGKRQGVRAPENNLLKFVSINIDWKWGRVSVLAWKGSTAWLQASTKGDWRDWRQEGKEVRECAKRKVKEVREDAEKRSLLLVRESIGKSRGGRGEVRRWRTVLRGLRKVEKVTEDLERKFSGAFGEGKYIGKDFATLGWWQGSKGVWQRAKRAKKGLRRWRKTQRKG